MPSNSDSSTDITFLFKGTIREVKAATMTDVPVDKNTVVAMVDQVLEAPANLSKIADRHYIIERGRTVWTGTSDQLVAEPDLQHRYLGI